MPATKQTRIQELSQRTKACLADYEQLRMVDNEKMASVLGIHINTMRRKRDNPEQFTLEEIWRLSMYLRCPIGQLSGGDRPEEQIGKLVAVAMRTSSV